MPYLIKNKDYMKVLVEKIFGLGGRSSFFHTEDGRYLSTGCELLWPKNVFADEAGDPTDNEDAQAQSYEPRSEKWAYLNKFTYRRKKGGGQVSAYGGDSMGSSLTSGYTTPLDYSTPRIIIYGAGGTLGGNRSLQINQKDAKQLSGWLMCKPGQGASFSLSKFWSGMATFYLTVQVIEQGRSTRQLLDIDYCTKTDEFGGRTVGGKNNLTRIS